MSFLIIERWGALIGSIVRGEGNPNRDGEVIRSKIWKNRPVTSGSKSGGYQTDVWGGARTRGRVKISKRRNVVEDIKIRRKKPRVDLIAKRVRVTMRIPRRMERIEITKDEGGS